MNHNRQHNQSDPNYRDQNSNRMERASSTPNDLPDNENDSKKLEAEETYIDLPDVKDIPGQEFVHAPSLGALADTTISSDGEEGKGIFDEEDDEDLISDESNISRDERNTLEQTDYMPTRDEDNLNNARMDNVDFQGDALNEKSFGEERTGSDLDIPRGSDTDRRGVGDEENRLYSLGNSDNEEITEERS